jgi:NADH-quinone oxidoreductase subunit K
MSIELMLNAVNVALVAFSRHFNNLNGQIMVFFIMAVAAAEAAIGLSILIQIYKDKKTLDVDEINLLKG